MTQAVSQRIRKLNGSADQHPERINKDEPCPDEKVGNAPRNLSNDQRAIWREIISQVPPGVITRMDRMALEVVSVLMDKFRKSNIPATLDLLDGDKVDPPKMQGNEMMLLTRTLKSLGMTPADRGKVSTGNGAAADTGKPANDGWADA